MAKDETDTNNMVKRGDIMKRILYIISAILVISSAYAQDYSTSAGRFLLLGAGARAGALGSANSAVAEDGTTTMWNPAGLAAIKSIEFSFMHMLYGQDVSYNFAASTIPLDFGTFGLNFIYMGMSPLEEMAEGDITGQKLNYYNMAGSLSFGREFFNFIGLGLTAKYLKGAIGIKETPDYFPAQGFAFDFGILARFEVLKFYAKAEKNLRLGCAVQNIGTKLQYDTGKFSLPMVIRPGLFYKPIQYASIIADYNKMLDLPDTINIGIELIPDWLISPRAGIKLKRGLKTLTFGGGLKYAINTFLLQMDYAYIMDSYLPTHMFSIAIRKFSAALAEFTFGEVTIQDIFPGMYKYYTKQPVTRVQIKNNTNIPIEKIKVSMHVNKYMDFPSESQVISSLAPGRETSIDLPAEFNNEILKITEDTPMQAQIKVDYVAEGKRLQLTKTESFKLYNRYSMTWDDFNKLAAFVTPKDIPIKTFARGIVQKYRTEKIAGFPGAMVQAILIFDALGALDMTYVLDPQSPYRQRDDTLELVDQIQYPRDTLRFKTGDCDDCAVLYCALLQNIGLNTAFIDVKDHIFMAFDTQISENEAFAKFGDKELYFILNETAWIPVETTLFIKGFAQAWLFASKAFQKASAQNKVTIIEVRKAWNTFYPVTLPSTKWESPFPPRTKILNYFQKDKKIFNSLGSTGMIAKLKSQLKRNPKNPELLNKLGITYGLIGNTKASLKYIKQAVKNSPKTAKYYNNLANVYFLENELKEALKNYQKAIKLQPDNPNFRINLANLYAIMGEQKKAEQEIEKAEDLLGK